MFWKLLGQITQLTEGENFPIKISGHIPFTPIEVLKSWEK
jgi:hypothetical protein